MDDKTLSATTFVISCPTVNYILFDYAHCFVTTCTCCMCHRCYIFVFTLLKRFNTQFDTFLSISGRPLSSATSSNLSFLPKTSVSISQSMVNNHGCSLRLVFTAFKCGISLLLTSLTFEEKSPAMKTSLPFNFLSSVMRLLFYFIESTSRRVRLII